MKHGPVTQEEWDQTRDDIRDVIVAAKLSPDDIGAITRTGVRLLHQIAGPIRPQHATGEIPTCPWAHVRHRED
jgi:hypothetical protein